MRTREPTMLQVRNGTLPEALLEDIDWRGYHEPCREAIIFPIRPSGGENVLGFLLMGVNPRRPYDKDYESFVNIMNRQLATSLASKILYEEELRKGEAAAQLAALEKEKLHEQLASQTRRFKTVADLPSVGIFVVDSAGLLQEANDTWYRLTGTSKYDDCKQVRDDSRS
jgi:GAF domain-containing protein